MTQMKKKGCKRLALALTMVSGAAFAGPQATEAAGVSSLFTTPVVGYVSATVVSTTAPVIIDMPNANGRTLLSHACAVRDSADRLVPRDLEVSTSILIGTATGMTSGTIAVGDKVNCVLFYQR